MKKLMLILLALSTSLTAEEKIVVSIDQGIFHWEVVDTYVDRADEKTKYKNVGLQTMPSDIEVSLLLGDWAVYLFPTEEAASFQLGYAVRETSELGLLMSYDEMRINGSATAKVTSYGLYWEEVIAIREASLEVAVGFSLGRAQSFDQTSGGLSSVAKASGIDAVIGYAQPIYANVSIVPSLSLSQVKIKGEGFKERIEVFDLMPLKIRVDF